MDRAIETASTGISKSELFDTLCNVRRLYILRYLSEHGRRAKLQTLVDYVAARENEKSVPQLSRTERRRVYISLYQTHLPKLVEQGLIEWNKDSNQIQLVSVEPLESVFETGPSGDNYWYRYYLALAVGFVVVFGLIAARIGPFELVPPLAFAAVTVLAFGMLSASQWFINEHRFTAHVRR